MDLFKTISCALLLGSSFCNALELSNDIALSGGWRSDKWEWNGSYDLIPPGFPLTTNVISDKVNDLNIWQIGVKGRLVMPELDCFCDYGFLDNFYLKGHAYWGWKSGSRNLSEFISNPTSTATFDSSAGVKSAKTHDYAIGLGYLIDLSCDWAVGVTGGYAWDKQQLKTGSGDTVLTAEDGTVTVIDPDPYFDGARWTACWQGPWVGADIFYQTCDWFFDLGYEYHFAHYHGKNTFTDIGQASGAADRTYKSNHGYGNVIYLDAAYFICENWQIGASFKWNQFRANKGTFDVDSVTFVSSNRIKNKWTSYGFNLDLIYSF